MQFFKINIYLRIITTSQEDGKLLILLDENGEIPFFTLSKEKNINHQIDDKLKKLLYENDIYLVNETKQFSDIQINTENESVDIYFNFLSLSTASKSGCFTIFNKKSIELHRLINNHSI